MEEPIRESGPHLAELLAPSLGGDGPLYRCLADGLKHAIDRGEIPLGTMLPPERSLARSLTVSRATVVAAYDRLKTEGWLDSRRGSGTWVRSPAERDQRHGVDAVATARLFLSDDGSEQKSGPGEEHVGEDDIAELSVAAVTGSATVEEILGSLRVDMVRELSGHHGYLPQGLLALRRIVAERFGIAGLPTGPDQVIVTTGAHQAISLVARQTLEPGDAVLVESPTFPGALDIFRRFGARMVPWPTDEDGVRTDVLADLLERTEPRLLYLSPHFHNPSGAVLPAERRREVGRLAVQHGTVIVEDLAMGYVRIDDVELPPPITALVPEAQVHTLGSTSKLFWAGLRVGWIRSPETWTSRILAAKTVADLGTPLISQLLAVELLRHFDRIQAERRTELATRRDLLCELLTERLPEWQFRRPPGGLSLWVRLPRGNADEFAELALRNGVAVVPGPALSVDDGHRRALRIVYARTEPVLRQGVDRLATAWERYAATSGRSAARLLV